MEIKIADTYEEMSEQASKDLLQLLNPFRPPLLCTASGDTPAGLYQQVVRLVHARQTDISDWYMVGLDEWAGMNGADEGSARFHLNRQLYAPLEIKDSNICFFDGRAPDLHQECGRVESFIKKHQGIDVAILGIGMNGHIGMNEPGTSAAARSHVADIHPETQKVGQKYFSQSQSLEKGVTLGPATLLEAKHIILMASGAKKAEIIQKMLTEEISEQLPATLLRNHPGLLIYLDKEAAQLVQ